VCVCVRVRACVRVCVCMHVDNACLMRDDQSCTRVLLTTPSLVVAEEAESVL
jgi:hypothetical protein